MSIATLKWALVSVVGLIAVAGVVAGLTGTPWGWGAVVVGAIFSARAFQALDREPHAGNHADKKARQSLKQ